MRHLGDITKISGYDAPIVDCIIGGSPCQDLSVAGKRAGLDGERSGLYMEQIRIVKEMRKRDEFNGRSGVDVRPRYMVWENVPGAFSSNKGEDFRIVLEEIAKVCDKDAVIPMPDKGKWTNYGCIVGDGWSVAWRVLDAQFWGVPQRRRRIALVADFGGQSAPEILFVRQSVSGHSDESLPKRKGASSDAEGSLGADDRERVYCIEPGAAKRLGGYVWEGLAPTLRTEVGDNRPSVAYGISSYNSNAMKSDNPHSGIYEADTSRTLDLNGGNPSCNQGGIAIVESVPYTLKIRSGCEGGGKGALVQEDMSATLACNNDQYLFQPVYSVENHPNDSRVGINEDGKVQALTSRMGTGGGNVPMVMQQCYSKQKRAQSATDNETWVESDTANTLNAFDIGDVRTTEAVVQTIAIEGNGQRPSHKGDGYAKTDKSYTLNATEVHGVVYALDRETYNSGQNFARSPGITEDGVNPTLVSRGPSAVCYSVDQGGGKSACNVAEGQAPTLTCTHGGEPAVCYEQPKTRYIVRRLTPLECERLQGYPDGWTDIGEWVDSNGKTRQTSDAARYKALGNSIALPPWKWVLKRLCACYERDATMASLFDGIGGFPYLWEQLNGKGTCLWASEIEEFPMAVTKVRIGK